MLLQFIKQRFRDAIVEPLLTVRSLGGRYPDDDEFKTRPRVGASMEQPPQEITTLVGREVYSNNGVFVGEVEDVRLDLDAESVTGLALVEVNREVFGDYLGEARGAMIPYRWVRAVGDVILINDVVERLRDEDEVDDVVA